MQKRSTELCPQCNILSLGTYLKTFNYYTYNSKVEVMPWISSKHNMGFAFNRSTWKEIRTCNEHFCSYDDYNWDWSLQHVSQQCLKHKLHAMIVKGPRIFHIGECGVHHKRKIVNQIKSYRKFNKFYVLQKILVKCFQEV